MLARNLHYRPDLTGTVFGLKGRWVSQAAGIYVLDSAASSTGATGPVLVAVHDGTLHLGDQPAESLWDGDRLHWSGLDPASPLGADGYLEFSPDGLSIVSSSLGCGGWRIDPDAASDVATMADAAPHDAALLTAAKAPATTYDINDLAAMSQFSLSESGNYYDKIQTESMQDFYEILQYYMDPEIRKQFFNPNPPPLSPGLYGIAQVRGTKGTEPKHSSPTRTPTPTSTSPTSRPRPPSGSPRSGTTSPARPPSCRR